MYQTIVWLSNVFVTRADMVRQRKNLGRLSNGEIVVYLWKVTDKARHKDD
jgi:hypothetical protein